MEAGEYQRKISVVGLGQQNIFPTGTYVARFVGERKSFFLYLFDYQRESYSTDYTYLITKENLTVIRKKEEEMFYKTMVQRFHQLSGTGSRLNP